MIRIGKSLWWACWWCLAACGAAHGGELVVGQVMPLTGVLATSGAQVRLGSSIYFQHLNAQGGVHGNRIRHVVLDDGYKVDETMRQTRRLIEEDKAIALVGLVGTANIAGLLKQGTLANAGIALVGPITGADALRTPFNPNIFHVRASYDAEAEHMVNHLVTLSMGSIGVFYQNDAFGKAGLAGVEAAMARRGLRLTASAGYERGTAKVDEAVAAMRSAAPAAIIMISVNNSTAAFAKGFRAAGGAAQLLNLSVVDAGELNRLAGTSATHGLGITQVMPFPFAPNTRLVREYHTLLKEYGPPGAEPSYLGLEGFLGAKVLAEGLRRAGPQPSRQAVLQALESLSNYDAGGFFVRYSKSNRVGSRFVDISVIGRDGKLLR